MDRLDTITMDLDDHLDVLGQQPFLNIYTQICSCYPVPDASSHPAIVNTLTNGLERLSASFPWLAGQVVNEGSGKGNTGIFKIKPFEKIPTLVVKDLRNDPSIPTMDALRQANFPFSMLDENTIAPRKTLPGNPDEPPSRPVFLVQANFITGGLLLTFLGQHGSMDMTGQGQVIDLFSKACRNEPFTSEELSSGNLVRRNIIPLLDDSYQAGPELARQTAKAPRSDPNPPPPPKASWSYFTFSPASLSTLKTLASKTITSDYISTDDALSAFIWQSVMRARLPRLPPTLECTFTRAVDIRPCLNIPKTYPGLMQTLTYHTSTPQKLVDEPLGLVASNLRAAIDPVKTNIPFHTSALATCLSRSPDKCILSFTASLDLASDLMISSWSKLYLYDLDFNLGLGKPESVRRPQFDPFESLIYLMPRSRDGEIAVGFGLRDEDMETLKGDEGFGRYATYVG